jgi:dihydroflavonol-4-reductase
LRRALVVGASGFIGLNLVDALLAAGFVVRATRRRKSPTIFLRKRPVELVEASLEQPDELRRAMEGCDSVFIAGAHYPRYSLEREASISRGVLGVRNACEAALAAKVKRFIFTSAVGALGPAPPGRLADERDIPPTMPTESIYRAVKWAMEREVDAAAGRGLRAVTLQPGGCIGPWDVRLGTGGIIVAVARGMLPWWTEGWVNMVDVGDVARAHVAAVRAPPGSRYCLGGHNVRVGELLQTIAGRYGGRVPTECLSHEEARARADREERAAAPKSKRVFVPREFVDMIAAGQPVSCARAQAELGLQLTPLTTALDRAYAWFVRFHYLPARGDSRVENA